MTSRPVRRIPFGSAATTVEQRPDGAIILRHPEPLRPWPLRLTERLAQWADKAPDRAFLAQRRSPEPGAGWRTLSYGEALEKARAIGQALLERGLSADRPLMILSDNDLEHGMLALAAMHAGIPYAPVSSAYSLISTDFSKLRYITGLITPGLVFASNAEKFGRAIEAVVPADVEVVLAGGELSGRRSTRFAELAATRPKDDIDRAHAAIGPDTIAKFLFTSGSTGQPKGVITTHGMLSSNQQMIAQGLPCLAETPPVLVEWAPWNHTAGGSHNFNLVMYNGGTLHIDEGKPVPALIERTVQNLREVAPTWYFNVPRGFEALLPYMRADEQLRRNFFSRLQMLYYAGAALAQPVWEAYEQLALETTGEIVPWVTGLGSTETAPFALCTCVPGIRAGVLGVPASGCELKLVRVEDKLEARFRGPHITPGYWRQPEATRAAFDEEGWYRMGDALRFADPARPELGLEFDGRISEDFKLATATWVHVGTLRNRFIAAGVPHVQDVVIAGHDRDDIGALVFPNLAACRELCPDLASDTPPAKLLADPRVRARFQRLLDELSASATGSSTRIARALLLEEGPSIDVGEMTDKGSINQRAVLRHRPALVEELYTEPYSPRVIIAAPQKGK